jgi:hypothetical protein
VSVFVCIAAYRDPQLIPTIEDCLEKAARPQELRFGICWQHGRDETPLPFAHGPRFRIVDVDWRESHGCCWARAEAMKLFDGEDWFLQLDAHHRFVQGWDAKLLEHAARTGSEKPVLTGLTPGFQPDDPTSFADEPLQTILQDFGSRGVPESLSSMVIPDWRTRRDPVRSRFITAGFLFAPGRFVEDVPYDPDIYFYGEETMLTIRAFTHGYDLFHPTEIILWHQYNTDGKSRPRHERDHPEWWYRDHASLTKVRRFLEQPSIGRFGCGTVRTFREYEAYAGINFRSQCTTDYTRRCLEPPNPPMPADWADRISHYEFVINIDKAEFSPADGCTSWWIEFWDARQQLVYRRTVNERSVVAYLSGPAPVATIRLAFASEQEPLSWRVLPYSKSRWLEPFEGASPRAWTCVRRIGPWEVMDGRSYRNAKSDSRDELGHAASRNRESMVT